jgi:pimeloyl-ACP methyl ester carboxylesterase
LIGVLGGVAMERKNFFSGYSPALHGELYYEVAGSGKPVLLIHAGVADLTMWDGQFDLFSQIYRVIRYDTRGYGRSRTENTEFSNRQDILDLFAHLGIDQAAIIGISRGGQIAIDFTIEHPERVTSLVAVAPGISGFDYKPDDSQEARLENELFTQMDELWEKKAYDQLAELEAHVWADGPSQPKGRAPAKIYDYLYRNVRSSFNRQDGQATPITLQPSAYSRLSAIQKPTLILIGEYDSTGAKAAAAELECQIAQARMIGVPGTAHMIPLEQPEKFNELVLAFIKETL